jgi:uncharacterized protein YegP (UPF0339 family)
MYATSQEMEDGIESVKRNALGAEVTDKTH